MKTLRIFSLLPLLMTAWTAALSQAPPVRIMVSDADAQATNISSKEIVLLEVMVSIKVSADGTTLTQPGHPAVHDFYFKPGGMAPGDIAEIARPGEGQTIAAAKLVFVQFADGTTWGKDPENPGDSAIEMAMSNRQELRAFYEAAITAYYGQGEQAFLDCLNQNLKQHKLQVGGYARQFLQIQKDSGTAAAVAQIQKRLDAAKARPF